VTISYRAYFRRPVRIFDVTDAYAGQQAMHGPHPLPIGPIKFLVLGQEVAGQAQRWKTPLEIVTVRTPSGFHVHFGVVQLPGGERRRSYLADGTYLVRVESAYYQPVEMMVLLRQPQPEDLNNPPPPVAIGLEPGHAYPFARSSTLPDTGHSKLSPKAGPTLLRGSLHHTGGRGIDGASVETDGLSTNAHCTTNKSGQWVLVVPDEVFPNQAPRGSLVESKVALDCKWPDPEQPGAEIAVHVDNVTVEWGRERSLAQAALRGWVHARSGAGIAGAVVEVAGLDGQSITGKDGSWSYFFLLDQPPLPLNVDVTATLPDGRSQAKPALVQPRATVVVPTFRFG
jgi:hypothetical protein